MNARYLGAISLLPMFKVRLDTFFEGHTTDQVPFLKEELSKQD